MLIDYDLERENFLYFYKTAMVEGMTAAVQNNLKFKELLRKYEAEINLINLIYGGENMLPTAEVTDEVCVENRGVVLSNEEAASLDEKIRKHLECKLTAFDTAIAGAAELEIDGVSLNGVACDEITQESKIKVLNHQMKDAYEVAVDTIVRTPLKDIILALKTGELIRLQGVTRIVGYYSRISNWNKSKIGELHDRHKGNYAVNPKPVLDSARGSEI